MNQVLEVLEPQRDQDEASNAMQLLASIGEVEDIFARYGVGMQRISHRWESSLLEPNDLIRVPHYLRVSYLSESGPDECAISEGQKLSTFTITALGKYGPRTPSRRDQLVSLKRAHESGPKPGEWRPILKSEQVHLTVEGAVEYASDDLYQDGVDVVTLVERDIKPTERPLCKLLGQHLEVEPIQSVTHIIEAVEDVSIHSHTSSREEYGVLDIDQIIAIAPRVIREDDFPSTASVSYKTWSVIVPNSLANPHATTKEILLLPNNLTRKPTPTKIYIDTYINFAEPPDASDCPVLVRVQGGNPATYVAVTVSQDPSGMNRFFDYYGRADYKRDHRTPSVLGRAIRSTVQASHSYRKQHSKFSHEDWQTLNALAGLMHRS